MFLFLNYAKKLINDKDNFSKSVLNTFEIIFKFIYNIFVYWWRIKIISKYYNYTIQNIIQRNVVKVVPGSVFGGWF